MGKGDKKTRRGKFFLGSYGVRRPRKKFRNKEIQETEREQEKNT